MRSVALLVLIFLYSCSDAMGCSCFSKGRITVEDFNSYDWIFTGKLISETRSAEKNRHYTRTAFYKVISAYKGVAVGDTVRVSDAEDSGACGLGRLVIGRDYLIYARGAEVKWTSDCTRTTLVPVLHWPQDSVSINKLKNLDFFDRIYDTTYTNFHADTSFLNKHVLKIRKNTIQKFYDEQGRISAEGRYRNGLAEGYWRYFENGKVVSKGKYIDDRKDSLWLEPFMDKMIYLREYKAGEFTYREAVFSNGKIMGRTEPVGDGRKWIKYDYHANGKVRYIDYTNPPKRNEDGRLKDPVSDGAFKMFNRSGILLQTGNQQNGFETGHWKYYYENGRLRMEGDYVEGKKTGLWKIYYADHRIKATGTYDHDKKAGTWKYFNKKGKEIPPDPALIKEDEDWFTYSGVKN